ncbi:DUF7684 family protein [Kumtagia ephedrae]|uniref:DUF7684 domain-containing protein n=1 Tax=Kumtagia ephedrae TaxID=2116701 RepID=A0A2P7S247_9HYPH|nr:hypothetical protein [Mesorhizobium ephedrae]PSJ56529.1 hypothetical protein C7I84_20375 [Mesorhizobium ephedrae]
MKATVLRTQLRFLDLAGGDQELGLFSGDIACLIVSRSTDEFPAMHSLIRRLLVSGCKYFLSWGEIANWVEDEVDAFVESDQRYLDVLTTSHQEEPADDVASFFVHATFPTSLEKTLYVIHCGDFPAMAQLKRELLALTRSSPAA